MTAEERIFSIVRGGLYAKLPSLALPLGRLTCREGDVDPAGTDGEAAVFARASAAGIPCGKRPAGAADAASAAAPHARPPVGAAGESAGALGYGLRSGGRPRPARAFAAGAGDACGLFRPLQAAGEAGRVRAPGDLRAAARAAGRADRGGTGRVLPGRPPPLAALRVCFRAEDRGRRRGDRAGRRSAGSCRTRCRRSP